MKFQKIIASIGLCLAAFAAQAQVGVNVSVGGEIKPGVYGRVDIGTKPPPAVIYPQPVIIVQQPVAAVQSPIYMNVPPGHAKKWSKHCYKYNACNQPVYFVKTEFEDHKGKGYGKGHSKGHGKGKGHGHGD